MKRERGICLSGCGDWSSIDSYLAAHKSFCHMHRTAICWLLPLSLTAVPLFLLLFVCLSPASLSRCSSSAAAGIATLLWELGPMHKYKFEQPTASGNDFGSDCECSSTPPLPSAAFHYIPGNPLLLPWAVFVLRPRATDSVIYCS